MLLCSGLHRGDNMSRHQLTLGSRKRYIETGINLLMVAGQEHAARELESVLLDIDAQLLGLTFREGPHGENSAGSIQPVHQSA